MITRNGRVRFVASWFLSGPVRGRYCNIFFFGCSKIDLMPRPLRIQFPGACYHIINTAAGRRKIFRNDEQFDYFLSLLAAVTERFGAEFHGYCLLGGGYQLMVRTPEANLERIMRHVNGLYTQFWNRSVRKSGALFRGRYKAVLVEPGDWWTDVSRYLHLAPVAARAASAPEDYCWSSYAAYIGQARKPAWLHTDMVLKPFGRRRVAGYRAFVGVGVSDELAHFYSRTHLASILGSADFRQAAVTNPATIARRAKVPTPRRPTFSQVVKAVARYYGVPPATLHKSARGRGVATPARSLAMYICQEHGGETLAQIADQFGLAGYASAGATIRNLRNRMHEDKALRRDRDAILRQLNV